MGLYLDKDAILKALTKEDVIRIVTDLGSAYPKDGGSGELIFQTVCHNVSGGSYKLYYYHEPRGDYPGRLFHCYSQCGESFSIIELVIRAKRIRGITMTFRQALTYIANMTNNILYRSTETIDSSIIEDWSWINRLKAVKKGKKDLPNLKPINEHILEMFSYYPYQGWLEEHIARESLSEFEIGYFGLTNQITIPHRDINGELIGIRGRFLDEEDVKNIGKYAPLCIEGKFLAHSLGNNLYGIFNNADKIKKCKKILLVESEKSVLQNHSYFRDNDFSLATCGSNITATQIRIMLQTLGVEEVILGYDKEFEDPDSYKALLYRNKLYNKVAPLLKYCKVSILWDDKGLLGYKDSPTDHGKDVLLELCESKKIITMKDLEELNK